MKIVLLYILKFCIVVLDKIYRLLKINLLVDSLISYFRKLLKKHFYPKWWPFKRDYIRRPRRYIRLKYYLPIREVLYDRPHRFLRSILDPIFGVPSEDHDGFTYLTYRGYRNWFARVFFIRRITVLHSKRLVPLIRKYRKLKNWVRYTALPKLYVGAMTHSSRLYMRGFGDFSWIVRENFLNVYKSGYARRNQIFVNEHMKRILRLEYFRHDYEIRDVTMQIERGKPRDFLSILVFESRIPLITTPREFYLLLKFFYEEARNELLTVGGARRYIMHMLGVYMFKQKVINSIKYANDWVWYQCERICFVIRQNKWFLRFAYIGYILILIGAIFSPYSFVKSFVALLVIYIKLFKAFLVVAMLIYHIFFDVLKFIFSLCLVFYDTSYVIEAYNTGFVGAFIDHVAIGFVWGQIVGPAVYYFYMKIFYWLAAMFADIPDVVWTAFVLFWLWTFIIVLYPIYYIFKAISSYAYFYAHGLEAPVNEKLYDFIESYILMPTIYGEIIVREVHLHLYHLNFMLLLKIRKFADVVVCLWRPVQDAITQIFMIWVGPLFIEAFNSFGIFFEKWVVRFPVDVVFQDNIEEDRFIIHEVTELSDDLPESGFLPYDVRLNWYEAGNLKEHYSEYMMQRNWEATCDIAVTTYNTTKMYLPLVYEVIIKQLF